MVRVESRILYYLAAIVLLNLCDCVMSLVLVLL